MLNRLNRGWYRRLSYLGLFGITGITIVNVKNRYMDMIEKSDEFSKYTNEEQKKHYISGMHPPFITKNSQELNIFEKYFSKYQFLMGKNVDEIKEKHSLKCPVEMKSFSEYSNEKIDFNTSTLVVGGPPALISAIQLIENKEDLIYLNDFRRIPISYGSAWHLEQDAQTEAPTNYKPTKFLFDQLKRLLFGNISLKDIGNSGEFPWRTIDWIGWIKHPEHWYRGFQLFLQFQILTLFNNRTNLLNNVAKQCFLNEQFFDRLNSRLNDPILKEEHGSIIIARNNQEIHLFKQLAQDLISEGRVLNELSAEEFFNRYHFIIPNALLIGEKGHDRVLVPDFLQILNNYLIEQGGQVLDGTLKTIYKDEKQKGGIALFINRDGQRKLIKFSRCILSLGNQEIFDQNKRRLFDVISARGVSILAHLYLPKFYRLPSVIVCGGTNHATKLSSQPIPFNDQYNLYLMKLTGGACITPNLSNEYTSYYDSTIATGLIEAVRKTFGEYSRIEPIFVYGCNRQVSRYGQIFWFEPYENIFIQYGAAGGGLTRAPDFITTFISQEKQ